jgi:16S rRNA (uracil1498-N3)-methyltransferase
LPADATPSWLWVASLGDPGVTLEVPDEEARYLVRVCRARPGESVTLTDGRGSMGRARVIEIAPRVRLELESRETLRREREAIVLCGVPEGNRADWLVEKLAELGVSALQPVQCERGVWPEGEHRVARLERLAYAALRQSRRAFLMEVRRPVPLREALAGIAAPSALWSCDPQGRPAGECVPPPTGVAHGLVGPSSGFTADEATLALDRGAKCISLADGRLRTETAAIGWALWWAAGR